MLGKAYKTVRHEIEAYGHGLADKPEIVALSKADALDPETLKEQVARLKRASKQTPAVISAASGQGVQEILQALLNVIDDAKREEKEAVGPRGMASVTTPDLHQFQRVVLKVGSALLVDRGRGRLNHAWLAALAEDIADLHASGVDVLVVSSGAIAMGRTVLGLPSGALKLEESQAAAAVGQIALARIWSEVLAHHGITAGQILVTLADTEQRRRYLNARATTLKLLEMRAVPVVNENDTVATSEIRYGDNDRLAARVATMIGADLLVLFSDIDGLYSAPPASDPDARAYSGRRAHHAFDRSHGRRRRIGIVARRHANQGRGGQDRDRRRHPYDHRRWPGEEPAEARSPKEGCCTWFLTPSNPATARKTWIAGALEPRGTLYVDDGAMRALQTGASLLPVGVRRDRRRVRQGRCGDDPRRRTHPRAGPCRLRRRGGGAHRRPSEPRDRGDPRLSGPRRDGAPGRHGARRTGRVMPLASRSRSVRASAGAALLMSLSKYT